MLEQNTSKRKFRMRQVYVHAGRARVLVGRGVFNAFDLLLLINRKMSEHNYPSTCSAQYQVLFDIW